MVLAKKDLQYNLSLLFERILIFPSVVSLYRQYGYCRSSSRYIAEIRASNPPPRECLPVAPWVGRCVRDIDESCPEPSIQVRESLGRAPFAAGRHCCLLASKRRRFLFLARWAVHHCWWLLVCALALERRDSSLRLVLIASRRRCFLVLVQWAVHHCWWLLVRALYLVRRDSCFLRHLALIAWKRR